MENQKALPPGRKGSGLAHISRGRALTLPANILAVGPEHSTGDEDNRYSHAALPNGSSAKNQLARRGGSCGASPRWSTGSRTLRFTARKLSVRALYTLIAQFS
jgi:hypothetical protein